MASFITPIAIRFHPKHFSYNLGASFRGLTVSESPNGYNIILRAVLSDGTAVYSMTVCKEIAEGLANLVALLEDRGGAKLWRFDKYANGQNGRGP